MKRKILAVALAIVAMLFAQMAVGGRMVMASPDPDESSGVETNIIKCGEDENGVECILNKALDIMSAGVGVLAFIGISVAGIQYLTAGGNEEQTRKAKRRIFEIVLGLAVYVLLFGIARWLKIDPNTTNTNTNTSTSSTNNTNTDSKAKKKASSNSTRKKTATVATRKSTSGTDANGTTAKGRKVMRVAEEVAGKIGKEGDIFYEDTDYGIRNWSDIKAENRTHCAQYVSIVLQEAGLIPKNKVFCLGNGRASDCGVGGNGNWRLADDDDFKMTVYSPGRTIADLVKSKKMVPGDVVGKADGWHTMIYRGKKDGKYYFYSVGPQKKDGKLVPLTKNWIIWRVYDGDYKIGNVFHPK